MTEPSFEAFISCVHPDDRPGLRSAMQRLLGDVDPVEYEFRVMLSGGRIRHLRAIADVRRDEQGQPELVIGTTWDVTDQFDTDRSAATLHALLDATVRSVPEALIIRDVDGRAIWFNEAYERMTGRTAEEIRSTARGAFTHPDDRAAYLDWIARSMDRPSETEIAPTFRILRPDGSIRHYQPTRGTTVVVDGRTAGSVRAGRDLTEQVELTRAMQERTAEADAIFAAAPRAMVVINESGTVLRANPAVTETLGWSPEELEGQNVAVLAADVSTAEHHRYMAHYVLTGEASTPLGQVVGRVRDVRARRRDGTEFTASLSVAELPADRAGRRFLGVIFDLTERLRAEEQVRVLQKNEALGTLIAGLAHNFNNVLTGIVGPLQVVQQAASIDDEARRWLDLASKASDQATLLVREMITFARPGTPEIERVDAARIVTEGVDLLSVATDRRVRFVQDVAPDIPTVRASRSGLQQVLLNLLVNARDAVLERLERDAAGPPGVVHVAVAAEESGDAVNIVVRDNGVGVPPGTRDLIFDPFFTTKPPEQGSGLGLSSVLTLVRQFGGTVSVEDAPGGGAVFTVRLAAFDTEREEPAPAVPSSDERPLAGLSVLVVDDEAGARMFAEHVLRGAGAGVTSTAGAVEGLRMLAAGRPHVVAFDLNMPVMNGWQFLLRARAIAPRVRAVVVAGDIDEQMRQRYRPDAVVHKPYRMEDLIEAVRLASPRSAG